MTKAHKIIYWVATLWLALGMVSTGLVQITGNKEEVAVFQDLGYPRYLMTILAVWKFLGVIIVLIPKFPLLKEWAYAGFFFTMTGAIVSHIAVSQPFTETLPALLLLVLTMVSWYFRPASRKLNVHQNERS